MKTAILLLAHGSRAKEANQGMYQVIGALRLQTRYIIEVGFMGINSPSIEDGVAACINQGAGRIVMIPYFLHQGVHVQRDLPEKRAAASERYPDVDIILGDPLGFHPKMVEIVLDRFQKFEEQASVPEIKEPAEIEKQSFACIDAEAGPHDFSQEEWPMVRRVIHATADFGFVQTFRFHPEAIEAGIDALSRGCRIITDVNMVKTGISQAKLGPFGATVHCFIADSDVVQEAKRQGITRSIVAMRKAAAQCDDGIIVVGNAPTALLEIIRLVQAGKARPAMIIGVPVGFVAASESKEELLNLEEVPYITTVGRKGGTPVAVAAMNALLNLAAVQSEIRS